MIEYHKIQSMFLRDPETKNKRFIMGLWSIPAFEYLANNPWTFTEKFDGTNVRVGWNGAEMSFGGRTNSASMPVPLSERLRHIFTPERLRCVFPDPTANVVLFGEGFGKGIQSGGNYIPDGVDFILFDVWCGGLYLERANVEDIAGKLGLRCVPIVGQGTLSDALAMAQNRMVSSVGTAQSEGLVIRPVCELQDRRGDRIITKLKYRDFN